jgi:thiol-disulfide isomerase/thioredoxin
MAQVKINIFADQLSEAKVTFYVYSEFLTEQTTRVGRGTTDEHGLLSTELPIENTTLLIINLQNVEHTLFVQPQNTYSINFSSQNEIVSIISEDKLNENIGKLLQDIEKYTALHSSKSGKLKKSYASNAATFIENTKQKFATYQNNYLNEYVSYHLAIIEMEVCQLKNDFEGLDKLVSKNLGGSNLLASNYAYWQLIDAVFKLRYGINENNLIGNDEADGSGMYLELVNKIEKSVTEEPLKQLLLIKSAALAYEYLFATTEKLKEDLRLIADSPADVKLGKMAQFLINNMDRVNKGTKIPDTFIFKNQEGKEVNFNDFRGKPILLEFWATWCTPCIKEMRDMPELKTKYGDKIQIVSISVDEEYEKMVAYLHKHPHYDWQFLHNGMNKKVLDAFAVVEFPTYFLIDADGKMVYKLTGTPKQEIKYLIELLAKKND